MSHTFGAEAIYQGARMKKYALIITVAAFAAAALASLGWNPSSLGW